MDNLMDNLEEMINNTYGKDHLLLKIEEWIQFVVLDMEPENHAGKDAHLELLDFLFTFKKALKSE